MTVKQMKNGELQIGDIVKVFATGNVKDVPIYVVIGIEKTNYRNEWNVICKCISGKLNDNNYQHVVTGSIRKLHSRSIKKVNVEIKEVS